MANHKQTDGDAVLDAKKKEREAELIAAREADEDFNNVIPANWIPRAAGFPPYLVMKAGLKVRVIPKFRDERDEYFDEETGEVRPFVRYHLELVAPESLECRRGPNDERGTPIWVKKGQVFSVGEYVQLAPEFNALAGLEMGFWCQKEVSSRSKTGQPRKRFDFMTFTSPETDRMLLSESAEDKKALKEAYRNARRLSAGTDFFVTNNRPAEVAAP